MGSTKGEPILLRTLTASIEAYRISVLAGVAVGSEDAKKGYAEKLRDRARERLNEA